MKTMTCSQLGGPESCDLEFRAETFEEMAELSKNHGMEMFHKKDEAHLKAMDQMRKLMQDPDAMNVWMANRMKAFEEAPQD